MGTTVFEWGSALRAVALVGVAATVAGVFIAPGVRGNAREWVVDVWDRASATLAYAFALLGLTFVSFGLYEYSRERRASAWARSFAFMTTIAIVALIVLACRHPLSALYGPLAPLLAFLATWRVIASASGAIRSEPTRALGIVLLTLGFASLARLSAWELASVAGERSNVALYTLGRGAATIGVVLEGGAQLVAAAWIGSRSRVAGQWLASSAVCIAFVLTWGSAEGGGSGAPLWQTVLHTALADAQGLPASFGLGAIATFLIPAGALLALVAALQPRVPSALAAAFAFALLSHGALDAPFRALAGVVAAQWAVLLALQLANRAPIP